MLIEVLPQIVDQLELYCSRQELRNLSRTCRTCHVTLAPMVLRTLQLADPSALDEVDATQLQQMVLYTRNLNVNGGNFTRQSMKNICKLKALRRLNLNWTDLDDKRLGMVCKSLHNIKRLNIGLTNVSDAGITYLQQLELLEELVLHNCSLTDYGIALLGKLTNLQRLDMSGYVMVSDEALGNLSSLPRLQQLILQQWKQLGDVGLSHIAQISQLRVLDLTGCTSITEDGLACLAGSENITTLILRNCSQIVGKGSLSIGLLRTLKVLDVTGCNVSDEFLYDVIERLPSIEIHNFFPC